MIPLAQTHIQPGRKPRSPRLHSPPSAGTRPQESRLPAPCHLLLPCCAHRDAASYQVGEIVDLPLNASVTVPQTEAHRQGVPRLELSGRHRDVQVVPRAPLRPVGYHGPDRRALMLLPEIGNHSFHLGDDGGRSTDFLRQRQLRTRSKRGQILTWLESMAEFPLTYMGPALDSWDLAGPMWI